MMRDLTEDSDVIAIDGRGRRVDDDTLIGAIRESYADDGWTLQPRAPAASAAC